MTTAPDVLVIDDNVAIAEIICAAVGTFNMSCRSASTAAEFLQIVQASPRWILMDLKMPDMDGPELLRLLALQGTTARIILMSGSAEHALNEVAAVAKQQGLDVAGVLVKPFRVPQLLAMLRT